MDPVPQSNVESMCVHDIESKCAAGHATTEDILIHQAVVYDIDDTAGMLPAQLDDTRLFIYARLLDETCTPVHVHTFPSSYTIAQRTDSSRFPWNGLGENVRVVGHIPNEFSRPGAENRYKVELAPTDMRVRKCLKPITGMHTGCSIEIIDIHIATGAPHDINDV